MSLSETIAPRAGEYRLHPVLFDGALQIFSAGAATVEGRKARLKLPVRFAGSFFCARREPRARAQAGVQQYSDEFVEGTLWSSTTRRASPVFLWMASAPSASRARVDQARWESRRPLPRRIGSARPASRGRRLTSRSLSNDCKK